MWRYQIIEWGHSKKDNVCVAEFPQPHTDLVDVARE
jgi:hypothetical protein